MKLHPVQIECTVPHRHDITCLVYCGDLQISREILSRDNPGVITPHQDLFRQTGKEIITCSYLRRRLYAVKDKRNIFQFGTKNHPYGLMA